MTCPAPIEIRNPGKTSLKNRSRSRIVMPMSIRERRGSPGKAAGSPSSRIRAASVRDGRSSVSRATVTSPSADRPSMITRMIL